MKLMKFIAFALLIFFFFPSYAQSWSIRLNGNETYPIGNELLGQYPILWYSSTEGRGVLVGGFGLGVAHTRPFKDQFEIKYQLNAQRSRFYDEPSIFTDFNGAPVGGVIGVNTNLNVSVLAMPMLPLSKANNIDLGLGLGLRGVFWSQTDYGKGVVNGVETDLKLKNRSLAPLVLLLPVEISWSAGRLTAAIRGELSVTKTTRISSKNDRSFIVFTELGYRIGK